MPPVPKPLADNRILGWKLRCGCERKARGGLVMCARHTEELEAANEGLTRSIDTIDAMTGGFLAPFAPGGEPHPRESIPREEVEGLARLVGNALRCIRDAIAPVIAP